MLLSQSQNGPRAMIQAFSTNLKSKNSQININPVFLHGGKEK